MSTPSEEEARAEADRLGYMYPARKHFIKGYLAALASRVSTPPSEQGSCWDEGPTLLVRDGECAPMPPRCELQAGHLGAHRGPRNMHGLATEWMTRPAATSPSEDAEAIARVREIHSPIEAVNYYGRNPKRVQVCAGCGTDDGNWQHYPCPTIRALPARSAVPVLPTEPEEKP